jgi:hypothetical protein
MSLIIPANSASAAGGFNVDNSLRFNSADSAHLDLTDPPGNNYYGQFTFSFWVKRCKLGSEQFIVQSSAGNTTSFGGISFNSSDQLVVQLYDSTDNLALSMITTRVFRDISAWYHIMVAFDLSDGTTADRIKIYVNGTRETSFATSTIPGSGFGSAMFINATDPLYIGRGRNTGGTTVYSDFYLAQFLCVTADSGDTDGLNADAELIPTQVGEFDEDSGIWKPIEIDTAVLGASLDMSDNLGTNGFFLDFTDSSNLGNDVNGGTDWDENNITATDQSTDTPTNNFATLNPLIPIGGTFSEGNLQHTRSSAGYRSAVSSIGVSSGKWYVEIKSPDSENIGVGVINGDTSSGLYMSGAEQFLGQHSYDVGYYFNGILYVGNSSQSGSWTSYTSNDIIGIAIDVDNGFVYFSKNGTFVNSGDPTSGATGTGGYNLSGIGSNGTYFIGCSTGNNSEHYVNFGNPTFTGTDQSDGNSKGSFEYAPPSGYLSLCTANLSEVLG